MKTCSTCKYYYYAFQKCGYTISNRVIDIVRGEEFKGRIALIAARGMESYCGAEAKWYKENK